MGIDARALTLEDRVGDRVGVTVGCGVEEEMAVGCDDGVRVRVGGSVGLGDGSTAVGVSAGSPAAQLATRQASPMAAASTMSLRHALSSIQKDKRFVFIVNLFRRMVGANDDMRISERDG